MENTCLQKTLWKNIWIDDFCRGPVRDGSCVCLWACVPGWGTSSQRLESFFSKLRNEFLYGRSSVSVLSLTLKGGGVIAVEKINDVFT
jgi:hypothetical protein